MGNIPVPYQGLTMDTWESEKNLLIYKVTSLSCCIIGTAAYIRPVEPYFAAEYFGILVPGFIIGYIIINVSEIVAMHINEEHTFLEVSFAIIGAIGSGICSIYLFSKWIQWMIDSYDSDVSDFGMQEFILGAVCLINACALAAVAVYRILENRSFTIQEE